MQPFNRRTLVAAALALTTTIASVGVLQAQEVTETPVPNVQTSSLRNTITVSGTGIAYGDPDLATMEVGVELVNADLTAAFNETATNVEAVIAALTELGIAETDIQTSGLSVYPEERYNPDGTIGERVFRVRNTVRVTVRDIETVSQTLTAAVNAGANTVYSLNFGLSDPAALEAEARQLAVENVRVRAEQLAAAFGVTLGDAVQISEVPQSGFPLPYGAGGAALDVAQQPISEGQLSLSVQVQVTFAIEG